MLFSRRLAAAFICVFVLGAVTGGMLCLNFADMRFNNFLNRTNDPASLADRLNKKLAHDYQLDAGQQARIAPLTQDIAQKLYGLRRKFGTDVIAALDESHRKIGAQLNPSQLAAYQKANEVKRQHTLGMLMPDSPSGTSAH